MSRHVCILIVFSLLALGVGPRFCAAEDVLAVRAAAFDVAYSVNEAALPLTQVDLWYTQDDGQTWQLFGRDEDRQSPVRFRAPGEGEYGFFVVLRNATGPSSAPPGLGDRPHERAFVDYTPPVVQLHPPRLTTSLGERTVQVRWTAIDGQLSSRPIRLEYQAAGALEWRNAMPEPLSNTGRFDWRVPEGLTGTALLRIVVTDRGGNQAASEPQVVSLRGAEESDSPPAPPASLPASRPSAPAHEDTEVTIPGSRRAQERVAMLLVEAQQAAERGDASRAIARLREAVRLDPQRTEAFVSLGGLLRQGGDAERALHAYEIALQQRPQDRDALVGSALVLREKREYESAANRLRTALRYVPDDAEAWMILGDVAVFQGNELLARDCYGRAMRINPSATQVIADAKQRLAIMAKASGD
jgi:tetratricopeptide (TPR) repeat protein